MTATRPPTPEPPDPEPPGPDPVDALLRAAGEQFRSRVTPLHDVRPDTGRARRGWIAAGVAAAVVALIVAGSTLAQRRPTGQPATPAPTAASTAASSEPSTGRLEPGGRLQGARWAESGSALDVTVVTPGGCPVDVVADPERVDPVVLTLLPRGTACHRGRTTQTVRVPVPLRVDPTRDSRVSAGGATVEVAPRSASVETPGALVERDVVPAADGVLSVAPPAETTSAVWAGWDVATGRLLVGVRGPGCAATPGAISTTAADRLEVTVAQPATGVDQSCNAPQWRFAAFLPPETIDRTTDTAVVVAGSGTGERSTTLPPLRPVLLGTLEGSPSWTGVTAPVTGGTAPAGTAVRWNPLLRQLAVTTVLTSCGARGVTVASGPGGRVTAVLRPAADPDAGCTGGLQQTTALLQVPSGAPYGSAAFPVNVLDGSSSTGPEFAVPATDLRAELTSSRSSAPVSRDAQGRLQLTFLQHCDRGPWQVVQVDDDTVTADQPEVPTTGVCPAIAVLGSVTVQLAPRTARDRPLTVYVDGRRTVLPPA